MKHVGEGEVLAVEGRRRDICRAVLGLLGLRELGLLLDDGGAFVWG
jgi:hypothetical protein